MKNELWAMLNESEQALLRDIEPEKLRHLDEDDLVELHDRVRRARTKYTKVYRRGAAAQVGKDRSRGRASATHNRARRKAEAFEDALARVSRQLAKVAKASADELKAERLAAARAAKGGAPARTPGAGKGKATKGAAAKAKRRTPASEKARASTKAGGKRKQAKRDGR